MRKSCYGETKCVFWRELERLSLMGVCVCEDGSELCPYGRTGIEGCMLTGEERVISEG